MSGYTAEVGDVVDFRLWNEVVDHHQKITLRGTVISRDHLGDCDVRCGYTYVKFSEKWLTPISAIELLAECAE